MAYLVTHWSRRDTTDRDDLGQAALEWCNAARAYAEADSARFYWAGPDTIVTVAEVDTMDSIDVVPGPEMTAAIVRLADLASRTRVERWLQPGEAEERYRSAQSLIERLDLP